MNEIEIEKRKVELLEEQNKILKDQLHTLKEMMAFWTRIVSDEYFNEMMKAEGHRFPS